MSKRAGALLFGSIILSVVMWGYIVSFKFGMVLVTAIMIHEYGHYWQMGREGIKNKYMMMIPPLGAVAMAYEPFGAYSRETRIALAGPLFGLLSIVFFGCLWLVTKENIFLASIVLAAYINLFNLVVPVAILDGGRVIKSILFSINYYLGITFYIVSLMIIGLSFVMGYISVLLFLVIGYFTFSDFNAVLSARKYLKRVDDDDFRNLVLNVMKKENGADDNAADSEKIQEYLDGISRNKYLATQVADPPKMSVREMVLYSIRYVGIICVYFLTIRFVSIFIDISISALSSEYF